MRYNQVMESKLAQQQKKALIQTVQRMTPEQRLEAFLVHCRLMTSLYRAGAGKRSPSQRSAP